MSARAIPKTSTVPSDSATPATQPFVDLYGQGLDGASALRLEVPAAPASARDGLQRFIEAELEAGLGSWGACSRPGYVTDSREAILSDQLYRARMLGYERLAIKLGSLNNIAQGEVLSPADSETLDWWELATKQRNNLTFQLDASDAQLLGFARPEALGSKWAPLFESAVKRSPVNAVMPLTAVVLPAGIGLKPTPPSPQLTQPSALDIAPSQVSAMALAEVEVAAAVSPVAEVVAGNARTNVVSFRNAMRGLLRETEATLSEPPRSDVSAPASLLDLGESRAALGASTAASSTPLQVAVVESVTEVAANEGTAQAVDCMRALRGATGSQSYESLETLFAEQYLPLRQALLDGYAPTGCAQALTSFSADFARSYARAFEALRTRGKRPTMVLDAPHIAFRLARQHAAPKHCMLLVDAMRFDIGKGVEERLQLQLLGHASCVARGTLWAALPADTATQLELIARGAEGLRQLSGAISETQLMSDVGEARKSRPMRVGPHHLYKLDIVQHQVNHQEGSFTAARLGQLAADAAVSVGRFVKAQAQGTLVFIFGDHGFNADRSTEPSPELVLVPYQAWLVR